MDDRYRQFEVLKMVLEATKDKEGTKLSELIDDDTFDKLIELGDWSLIKMILFSLVIKGINGEFLSNRKDDYGITECFYPELLNKMKQLAGELGLNNSLELSNLYTYLMWNGYLSKSKSNIYKTEGRKLIRGLYFADLMDGIGVCLNHSDMLTDFLNVCGYESAVINNYFGKDVEFNYRLDIERKTAKDSLKRKILYLFVASIIKKIGNHAFSLVVDKEKLYIYDSTNFMLLEVVDPFTAKTINGTGTFELHPYFSFMYAIDDKEIQAMHKLFEMRDLSSPYSRKDFIYTGEANIELFNHNIELLDDFYDDVRPSIVSISDATDKIKARRREK